MKYIDFVLEIACTPEEWGENYIYIYMLVNSIWKFKFI